MNTERKRAQYLDIAKGIGIILVVYGHLLRRQKIFADIEEYSIYIYSFHMALFFFVSGICLHLKYSQTNFVLDIKKEIFGFFRRLLIPYMAWSFLYIFFSKAVGENFITKLKYTFTFHGIAPVWFLGTLFFCEVVFALIYKLVKNNNIILIATIAVNVICTYLTAYIRMSLNLQIFKDHETLEYLSISIGRFFACNSILFIGYLFAKLDILKHCKRYVSLILGVVFMALLIFICFKTKNEIVLQYFKLGKYSFHKSTTIYFICSILGSLGIVFVSYAINTFRPLSYIGKQSLGIMLIHYLPMPTLMYSVELVSMISDNMYFCLITSGIVSVVICLFGILLCKKKLFLVK